MGLSWQQGPPAPGAIGRFLVPDPLPKRLLYTDPDAGRRRLGATPTHRRAFPQPTSPPRCFETSHCWPAGCTSDERAVTITPGDGRNGRRRELRSRDRQRRSG